MKEQSTQLSKQSLKSKIKAFLSSTTDSSDAETLYDDLYQKLHYAFMLATPQLFCEAIKGNKKLSRHNHQAGLLFLACVEENVSLPNMPYWEDFDQQTGSTFFHTFKEYLLSESKQERRGLIDPYTTKRLDYGIQYDTINQSSSLEKLRPFLLTATDSKHRKSNTARDTTTAGLLIDCLLDHMINNANDGRSYIRKHVLKSLEKPVYLEHNQLDLELNESHFAQLGININDLLHDPSCLIKQTKRVKPSPTETRIFIDPDTTQHNLYFSYLSAEKHKTTILLKEESAHLLDHVTTHPGDFIAINLPIEKITAPDGLNLKGIMSADIFQQFYGSEGRVNADFTQIDFTRYQFIGELSLDHLSLNSFSPKSALHLLMHAKTHVPVEWYKIPINTHYRELLPNPSLLTEHKPLTRINSIDYREVFLPALPIPKHLLMNKGAPDDSLIPANKVQFGGDPALNLRKQGFHIVDSDTWWILYLQGVSRETFQNAYRFQQKYPDYWRGFYDEQELDLRNKHPEAIISLPPRGNKPQAIGMDNYYRESLTRFYKPTSLSDFWWIFLNVMTLGGLCIYLYRKRVHYALLDRYRRTALLPQLPDNIRRNISLVTNPLDGSPMRHYYRHYFKNLLGDCEAFRAMSPEDQKALTGEEIDDILPELRFKEMFFIIISFGLYLIPLRNKREKLASNHSKRLSELIPQLPEEHQPEIRRILIPFENREITQPARDYLHYRFGGCPEFQALSETDQNILFGKLPDEPQAYFQSMRYLPLFGTHRELRHFVETCYTRNKQHHIEEITRVLDGLKPWGSENPSTNANQASSDAQILQTINSVFIKASKNKIWLKRMANHLLRVENSHLLSLISVSLRMARSRKFFPKKYRSRKYNKLSSKVSWTELYIKDMPRKGPFDGSYWNPDFLYIMMDLIKYFPPLMQLVGKQLTKIQQANLKRTSIAYKNTSLAHRRFEVPNRRAVTNCTEHPEARAS